MTLTVTVVLTILTFLGRKTTVNCQDLPAVSLLITQMGQNDITHFEVQGPTGRTLPISNLDAPFFIAYNPVERRFYWTDIGSTSIFSAKLDGSDVRLIKKLTSGVPVGIAIDSVAGFLYYTDLQGNKITRLNFDGSGSQVVMENITMPKAIAVDTANRFIYWTTVPETEPSIERAKYDGSQRTILTRLARGTKPNGLALDIKNSIIYWCEKHRIMSSSVDGTGQRVLVIKARVQYEDIAFFNNMLFITDSTSSHIKYLSTCVNNAQPKPIPQGTFTFSRPFGIATIPSLGNGSVISPSAACPTTTPVAIKTVTTTPGLTSPSSSTTTTTTAAATTPATTTTTTTAKKPVMKSTTAAAITTVMTSTTTLAVITTVLTSSSSTTTATPVTTTTIATAIVTSTTPAIFTTSTSAITTPGITSTRKAKKSMTNKATTLSPPTTYLPKLTTSTNDIPGDSLTSITAGVTSSGILIAGNTPLVSSLAISSGKKDTHSDYFTSGGVITVTNGVSTADTTTVGTSTTANAVVTPQGENRALFDRIILMSAVVGVIVLAVVITLVLTVLLVRRHSQKAEEEKRYKFQSAEMRNLSRKADGNTYIRMSVARNANAKQMQQSCEDRFNQSDPLPEVMHSSETFENPYLTPCIQQPPLHLPPNARHDPLDQPSVLTKRLPLPPPGVSGSASPQLPLAAPGVNGNASPQLPLAAPGMYGNASPQLTLAPPGVYGNTPPQLTLVPHGKGELDDYTEAVTPPKQEMSYYTPLRMYGEDYDEFEVVDNDQNVRSQEFGSDSNIYAEIDEHTMTNSGPYMKMK